jgi:hypothetical protein
MSASSLIHVTGRVMRERGRGEGGKEGEDGPVLVGLHDGLVDDLLQLLILQQQTPADEESTKSA